MLFYISVLDKESISISYIDFLLSQCVKSQLKCNIYFSTEALVAVSVPLVVEMTETAVAVVKVCLSHVTAVTQV